MKCCEYNNKDEDNSSNTLNDKSLGLNFGSQIIHRMS